MVVFLRIVFFIFLCGSLYSQKFKKFKYYYENSHSIYCEAGYFMRNYNGAFATINYDGIVLTFQRLIISLRGGIGYSFGIQKDTGYKQKFIFPMAFHFNYTRYNVEVGAMPRYNVSFLSSITRFLNTEFVFGWFNQSSRQLLSPFIAIGIRHQRPDGGLLFRLSLLTALDIVHNKNSLKTIFFSPVLSLGKIF